MVPLLQEAALSAITKAVFDYLKTQSVTYAKDQLGDYVKGRVGKTVQARFGREPEQLAFQIALAKAYTTFTRHHSDLAGDAGFFNEEFLRTTAAPFLARCLPWAEPPHPGELAIAWADYASLQPAVRERWLSYGTRASVDFLRFFRAELRARDEFQQDFDSMAIDAIAVASVQTAASSAQIAQSLSALKQELAQALTQATRYQVVIKEAKGSVIGDNANVTNVFQTFFAGDYANLQEFYIPPDEVFERVRLNEFVGRTWLEGDLDEFLDNNDRGVWLLVGEAGIGKTSFLAHLVWERGYLHFFAEQAPGDANLSRALQSLSVQLISRYRLEPYVGRDTLPQTLSSFPDFLSRLLWIAAKELGAGERLVIVVDALDEAGSFSDANVLGLPRQLPQGVYLILSQRPQSVALNIELPLKRVDLNAGEASNRQDISAYLHSVARIKTIVDQLQAQAYTPYDFVRILAEKSAGNWIYLHYLVEDLRRGQRVPFDLATLPTGLVGYYAQYWTRWRNRGEWDKVFAPLLATLAAAFEPLSARILKQWAAVEVSDYELGRLLREEWNSFIYASKGEENFYRLYHLSLQEFLSGAIKAKQFPPRVEGLLEELRERNTKAHRRIVASISETYANDWKQIAAYPYAHRYLSSHLRSASNNEELFALVDNRDWYFAQVEVDPSGAAYINDVTQAWMLAEQVDADVVLQGKARSLGRETRSALAIASVHSFSRNIPGALLTALVNAKQWSLSQALAAARQNPDAQTRAEALHQVSSLLDEALRLEVLREALTVARTIWWPFERLKTLVAICRDLSAGERSSIAPDILNLARHIKDGTISVQALATVASILEPADRKPLLREGLDIARNLGQDRSSALGALASHLSESDLAEALDLAKEIAWSGHRASALAALTPVLNESQVREVLAEALAIGRPDHKAVLLVALVPRLPEAERPALVSEVLSSVSTIGLESRRAEVLVSLAPYLSAALIPPALALARAIMDPGSRADALAWLARYLAVPERLGVLQEALDAARNIDRLWYRAEALAAFSTELSDEEKIPVLREAIGVVSVIDNVYEKTWALTGLAPCLPDFLLREALRVAREIEDVSEQVQALAVLIPYASEAQRPSLFDEVLVTVRSAIPRKERARAEVLRVLALHQPAPERLTLLREALEAAREIEIDSFRVEVLGLLAASFPESERLPVLREALHVALAIDYVGLQAFALRELAQHLTEPLLGEAIDVAKNYRDADARAWALSALAAQLPNPERTLVLRKVLDGVRSMREGRWRAPLLARVALGLPDPERLPLLRETLDIVLAIDEQDEREEVLAEIADTLPEPFLREVLALDPLVSGWSRALALVALLEYIPAAEWPLIISESLDIATRTGGRRGQLVKVLTVIEPHLLQLPPNLLYPLWQQTIRQLSRWTRPDLLVALVRLAPVLAALGGEKAVDETAEAILDLGTVWWP